MKKTKLFVGLCSIVAMLAFSGTAKAEEVYYTNDNGISMTKEQYDFIGELYWDGFQKIMPVDQFENLVNGDYFDKDIKSYYSSPILPIAEVSDSGKTLKASKVCGTKECTIIVTLTWLGVPSIRSYDIMGMFFKKTTLKNIPTTVASSTTETNVSPADYNVKASNGFANSVHLPATGTSVRLTQNYIFEPEGVLDISYQHAIKKTTLQISREYTFSEVGYGGVFDFYGSARDVYDDMPGIRMTLP